ncbi:hypothetical protein HQ524_02510, partial [Candidatus Uhrbacteria bacterium]|nr:hypothetical protein [Candidatus Uhrbacteria bacterium]
NVGSYYESSNFSVDSKNPEVSNVSASQTGGTTDVVILYDLVDVTTAGHLVEIDISDDGGSTWTVADTSLNGAVGSGQITGTNQTITWDAGTDFAGQYEADMRVRVRSIDYYGNQGAYSSSSSFSIDTAGPVISNLVGVQDAGANTVTVTYDLSDDAASGLLVSLDISEDGGVSWLVTDTSVSGDIGSGQTTGVGNSFTWDAEADFAGQDVPNMRVRLSAVDAFSNSGLLLESSDFTLDTADPAGLAGLSAFSTTNTTATLNWTPATDTNFDHYELWHGATQADVQGRTGTALEWNTTDDPLLSNALTISTVITGVVTTSDLFVKIWAVDSFGNELTVSDINVYVASAPTPTPTPVVASGGGSGQGLGIVNPVPSAPILSPIAQRVNYTNIRVSGLAEPGYLLHLYDNGSFVGEFISPADAFGRFGELFTLTEGIHRLAVQAVDSRRILSPFSETVTFVIDLSPPVPSEIKAPSSNLINDETPVLTGVAEPFATIEIVLDNTTTFVVEADNDGNWSLIIPSISALDIGEHEFTIRVIDQANNVSEPSSVIVELVPGVVVTPLPIIGGETLPPVVIAPVAPSLELLEELSGAIELPGLPRPQVTQAVSQATGNTFRFAGIAMPNSDVAVYVHSTQALAYFTKTDDEGVWAVEHSQDDVELAPGDHTIYAVAVDPVAKVKTGPGAVSVFTVEKNMFASAFSYLNLYTTIATLIVLMIILAWLQSLRRRGVEQVQ